MEYDVSRVYTSVNADELKVGSRVCVAKNMHALKDAVFTDTVFTLVEIASEDCQDRFIAEWTDFNGRSHTTSFTLAHLAEEPKSLKSTDLKVGDIIRCVRGKNLGITAMVIRMDPGPNRFSVYAGMWLDDKALADWEKIDG